MMMDLVQLRTFVAVAEEEHLTRAAERLHLSQSAASAHVKAIEEAFGLQLFARTGRGLELTAVGRDFLRDARDLLNQAARLATRARELGEYSSGTLHVGCTAEPLLSRLGNIVQAMRVNAPGIHLSLQSRTSLATRDGLRSGELDVGLFLSQPTDADFDYLVLRSVDFCIVGPAAWRKQLQGADWPDLARLPWLGAIGNTLTYARMLDELFAARGLLLRIVAETDDDLVRRSMVAAGTGLSLVREDHAREGEQAGLMATASLGRTSTKLLLAYLSNRSADPLVKSFVASTRDVWPEARELVGERQIPG